jgi:SAM-dependent methyltransferase
VGFLSSRTWQFSYFAAQLNDWHWEEKDVLDFGGNIGNMLRDPLCAIDEERYWCVDVIAEAIAVGKASYPRAHFHHYDRFCYFFNPRGVPGLKVPALEARFDYIVAYSVFTNASRSDMLDLVEQLRGMLKEGGTLAFTFIDPHFHSFPERNEGSNLLRRLKNIKSQNPDVEIDRLAGEADGAQWCVLVDDRELYVENEAIKDCPPDLHRSHYVFYTEQYMQALFPEAIILPPANNEGQHCCVIKAAVRG